MTLTSGHFHRQSGGGGLPAPQVQDFTPNALYDPIMADGSPSSGGTVKMPTVNYIKVTVPGIPQFILDDVDTYKPLIELCRYTHYNGKRSLVTGQRPREFGYKHPANGPTPSGNGSFTHGGIHGGVDAFIRDLRITEWPVASGLTWVDVTQSMWSFMCLSFVPYRLADGSIQNIQLPIPTSSRMRRTVPGKTFPYGKAFTGAYFYFRLSIIDPSDPRGKRITGPSSKIIHVEPNTFPFNPDGLDPLGKAACVLAPTTGFLKCTIQEN